MMPRQSDSADAICQEGVRDALPARGFPADGGRGCPAGDPGHAGPVGRAGSGGPGQAASTWGRVTATSSVSSRSLASARETALLTVPTDTPSSSAVAASLMSS